MSIQALMLSQKIAGGGGSPPAFSGVVAVGNYTTPAGNGDTTTTTDAVTTTLGRGMVALIAGQAADNSPSFSDSKGNSWTKVASLQNGTDAAAIYVCPSLTSAGSGHTFSVSWLSGYNSVAVLELDRAVTIDASSSQTDTGTPWDGALTTGQPNTLCITSTAVWATSGSWTLSASGWTWYGQLPIPSDAGDWDVGMLYNTKASAGANNISMTGTDVDGGTAHHLIMVSLY